MAEKKRGPTGVSIHLLYLYCVLCCLNVKPIQCVVDVLVCEIMFGQWTITGQLH